MSDAKQKHQMTYSRVGGNYQLLIRTFEDLPSVLELDEAFWALNCIDVNSLRMDRRFLTFVDGNNDGKIRTDEIRTAVAFFLKYIKNGEGFEKASDTLDLESVDPETGSALLESARLILKNLGKEGENKLTLEELRNDKAIRSRSYNNGDGVVTPDSEQSDEINSRIELVMKTAGSADDISGVKGVNKAMLEKFALESTAFLEWDKKIADDDGTLLCFGENTQTVYEKYLAVKEDIDNYFLNSETLEFFSVEPERVAKKDLSADVRAPQEVKAMLEKSVLALPRTDCTLDLNDRLNPLLRANIEAFFALKEGAALLEDNKLTAEEWTGFKKIIAPYDGWSKAKPAFAAPYSAVDKELLIGAADDEIMEILTESCANDLNAGAALAGIDMLHKVMLYQRYLKELLNNFVSLAELFDLSASSPIQAGKLIMDGRHFTLAVPVADLAEHKRIVAGSNICVLYIELSSTAATVKPLWKTLAVAVSSGNMRNLFVGKRGLFFTVEGDVFDAKVTAFVEQPVSISEALKNPFYRFGAFIGDQISKFFNTKSATAQKDMGGKIAAGKVPAAPAPAQGNASMLLMGGGIGIAALGSSIAFITKQLQNVSIWDILSVILGIILIFGGPVVIISLFKLYYRDLSRFLEATGCAVNRRMRMTRKMGEIFTFQPIMPDGKKIRCKVESRPSQGTWKRTFAGIIIALLIAAACGGVWYMRGLERKAAECRKRISIEECSGKKAAPSPKAPAPAAAVKKAAVKGTPAKAQTPAPAPAAAPVKKK